MGLLTAAISNPTVAEKTGGRFAIDPSKGVAQGLSISNVLAEIYLLDFDEAAKHMGGIFYSRYVDDILVLCKNEYPDVAEELVAGLKRRNLAAHKFSSTGTKSKSGEISDGFDYLGYEFRDGEISVRRSSVLNLEQSIVKIFTAYKHSLARSKTENDTMICKARLIWHLNLRITGCIYNGQRLGWVFYFSQLTDTGVLRKIDSTVKILLKRFGVPPELKPKRVLKAFYESARVDKATHRYIPNFDLTSSIEQVEILMKLGFPVAGKSLAQITAMFSRKIKSAVSDLERDLQQLS